VNFELGLSRSTIELNIIGTAFTNTEGCAQECSMNPFIIDESRERYQDRLNEAEQGRQAQQARANRVSRINRFRVRIGDYLIVLGQSMKAARPEPQLDEVPPAGI
jgi:hypothetical protein